MTQLIHLVRWPSVQVRADKDKAMLYMAAILCIVRDQSPMGYKIYWALIIGYIAAESAQTLFRR